MYLRCNRRFKDGKEHRYWNIVESKRCGGGKVVQRQVLYLGEINDSQREAWCRVIEAFDEKTQERTQLALFPAGDELPEYAEGYGVQVRLEAMELHRPRQWGACWLACHLYEELELDRFWEARLADSREGTCWRHILQTLICYQLIDPGSEWRLHRLWFDRSAMADLIGEDYSVVEKNALYRCLDKVLEHKTALFSHLTERWQDLFGAKFDVLLYDLTSTYFESSRPADEKDKRRYGYSRDKRSDCVQVVIALVVSLRAFRWPMKCWRETLWIRPPWGVFAQDRNPIRQSRAHLGDGSGHSHRKGFKRNAPQYPAGLLLVGTPKGRLTQLEKELLSLPFKMVRSGVEVKLLAQEKELYVLAKSVHRVNKERAMRRRQLRALLKRLKELHEMKFSSTKSCCLNWAR